MDHRFKLKQIWIETDLIADKSQQILLTQKTLPNRVEACKKKKRKKSQRHFINYMLPKCPKKPQKS